MISATRRFAAVPVPAKIGRHHRKVSRQLRRNLPPHQMGFRITVEQQKRRAAPAGNKVDRSVRGFPRESFKPRKKLRCSSIPIRLFRESFSASKRIPPRNNHAHAQRCRFLEQISPRIVSHSFDPPESPPLTLLTYTFTCPHASREFSGSRAPLNNRNQI